MQTMDARVATGYNPAKDPHLPPMIRVGELISPRAPQDIAGAKLEDTVLIDLAMRLAYTVARFSTDWVCNQLHLSLPVVQEILEHLCQEAFLDETMKTSEAKSHYRITERGREHAARSMEVCGYIGPAPVRLDAYAAMLRWQFANSPPVKPEHVTTALSGLVLAPRAAHLAALAVSSGRSLFVYGP